MHLSFNPTYNNVKSKALEQIWTAQSFAFH